MFYGLTEVSDTTPLPLLLRINAVLKPLRPCISEFNFVLHS